MVFKFAFGCKLVLLCMLGAMYAQDAGSPSAGGSVTADLGSPMSTDERIQHQAKHLEQMQMLSTAGELKLGDMDELKKAYVKTRKSGVDISPEDFLAFRIALDKLDQASSAPKLLAIQPGESATTKLNQASMLFLIENKAPTTALMDKFKLDKKAAQAEWNAAKQVVKDSQKKTKNK